MVSTTMYYYSPQRRQCMPTVEKPESHPRPSVTTAYAGASSRRDLGSIFLVSKSLDIHTIVHESTHAALYWFHRKFHNQPENREELFCDAVGNIAAQITQKFWDLGVYK